MKDNCPGNQVMQDGKCPVFQCTNHTSCNCNGNCTNDGSACICNVGFDGIDCSIDLIGNESYTMWISRLTKINPYLQIYSGCH